MGVGLVRFYLMTAANNEIFQKVSIHCRFEGESISPVAQ